MSAPESRARRKWRPFRLLRPRRNVRRGRAGGGAPASWLDSIRQSFRRALFENTALKFVALVLAMTLFILVNTNKDALIGVDVGVVYTMPEDRVLVSEKVDQVRLTLKGSWRRIKRFDQRELERMSVDLTNLRSGELRFRPDDFRLPPGITLLAIEPAAMPLRFEAVRTKTVPVHIPPPLGRLPRGYKVDRMAAKPSRVTIRGAESVITAADQVATRALDLDGRADSFTETLPLVTPRPEPIFRVLDGDTVDVEVKIVPERGSRKVEGVAVEIRPGTGVNEALLDRFTVEPDRVDVILHGPLLDVEAYDEAVIALVEAYPDDLSGRRRKAAVRVDNVPEGIGVEISPETVTLRFSRPP